MTSTITLTKITEERHYSITGVDDLQDSSTTRRRVLRPRELELGMVPGKPLVLYACIKGRQVRADGHLGDSIMILAGIERGDAVPPEWLDDFLKVEDLSWVKRWA
jgi:hypothetical protein